MSKRPRVLFVLPSMDRNGAVDFIVDLAGAMASEQCEVEILFLNGAMRDTRLPKGPLVLTTALREESSLLRKIVPVRRIRDLLRSPILIGQLIRSIRRSDVVVLTWEMGFTLLLPSVASFIVRKPTVAIVQNNIQRSIVDYSHAIWKHILRWAYARARAVVCVTHDLKAVVEKVGVSEKKLFAIPNAVNVERVKALATQPAPSTLPTDSLPFIIGVGRLASQKGFDFLILAHAEVRKRGISHRLILVGDGCDKNALIELAVRHNVSDSVLFLGHLDNPYPAVIRSSACCLSSRFEGRPLVLSETALLGVPMIAANCLTGPREILADGEYGDLVKTESVDALSAAIERHLRDPQRLILKAKESAKNTDRVSIHACAKSYVTLIRKCLN
jgi:glycosyltransferase involved in cell wall biosynthesis